MSFYWELTQFDGTVTQIPPDAVETVKRRWDAGQPIHTRSMTIPANQIKSFRQTAKSYGSVPLLEEAAAAFKEPLYNEDGSIVCRWVKKTVPQHQYHKFYSALSAYKKLSDDGSNVELAFFLPVDSIDLQRMAYCSESEVQELEKHRRPHEA